MTTTLNATTSNGLVVTPDNSGNIQLQYNGVAAPAFSAYVNATQSITGGASTKVRFDAETFDTNNNYDTSNYRFLPTVAGYYQINATVMMANTSGFMYAMIYKNGTNYSRGSMNNANASSYPTATANNVVYCNGTTDYIEIWVYFSNTNDVGGGALGSATGYSSFSGCLLRGA